MIWILPVVLTAAAAYSIWWFIQNNKVPASSESEKLTDHALAILSKSLFKRRGFLSGMIFTGQSQRLNQNSEQKTSHSDTEASESNQNSAASQPDPVEPVVPDEGQSSEKPGEETSEENSSENQPKG